MSGRGRLTNKRINVFQNLYGHNISTNKGNPEAMSKAVKASLKHYCSTREKPQHDDCPPGPKSWCSYQRDLANGTTEHREIKDPIPEAIQSLMTPIFDKLGDPKFLEGCKNLRSSNPNESFHHVLWSIAPKEQYNSSQEIALAVNIGTCTFNSGFAWTYKKLLCELGISVSKETKSLFNFIDKTRVINVNYKTQEKEKVKRRNKRKKKNKLADSFIHAEGVIYSSGKFY